ncbi:unnamed protein product [Vitrella brassicaformis CCMP3155]|uniref:Uncharacterized protein n=1 Tax=Vitrella brassicaformis (strain CCMP3155) TaxID=1169540 RepID=A0A0G4EEG3_VITBC|nr:unnamed protein product [Vitrella brassicaformis CCMP3155]|eukprot:CEL94389.1 unnamed protein product [Vitrella brassicaformis CCMP3155]
MEGPIAWNAPLFTTTRPLSACHRQRPLLFMCDDRDLHFDSVPVTVALQLRGIHLRQQKYHLLHRRSHSLYCRSVLVSASAFHQSRKQTYAGARELLQALENMDSARKRRRRQRPVTQPSGSPEERPGPSEFKAAEEGESEEGGMESSFSEFEGDTAREDELPGERGVVGRVSSPDQPLPLSSRFEPLGPRRHKM